jgi:choline dehydrogenase-like flavoprotein
MRAHRRSESRSAVFAGAAASGSRPPESSQTVTATRGVVAATKASGEFELATSYDYIVVGSGAGGGPVAAKLARAGSRVLLIEAGSADAGGLAYHVPAFHAASTDDPSLQWNYFVRHWEHPPALDSKLQPQGIWYPRASALGGCTAHNAMITVCPDDEDWDAIAAVTGDASWASSQMRAYYQRLEQCHYRPRWKDFFYNSSGHGYSGWLPTSVANPLLALDDGKLVDTVRAAAEAVGARGLAEQILHGLVDPNDVRASGNSREGLFLTPLAVANGARHGTRELIENTRRAFPDRLTVLTEALVTRVLIEGTRAVGVEYLPQAHAYAADPASPHQRAPLPALSPLLRQVRADHEVILSAGAFNSPQLLMLSGIGPRAELERHGIALRIERPGVGANLQDRYEIGVISRYSEPFSLLNQCNVRPPRPDDPPDRCLQQWQRDRSGVYATNGVVIGVIRRSRRERPLPDLYIFGFPGAFRGYYPGYSVDAVRKDHFTWAILKAHTENTAGEVRLRSADPRDTPDILFRYFEEGNDRAGDDLQSVVDGVFFIRDMNRRLAAPQPVEVVPGPSYSTREQVADYVRREAWGHHASCSNKMGLPSDPTSVVDSRFCVHGVQGLRVVDASIFPRIPGFFIVSAVYMISEKAADAILGTKIPAI